MTSASRESHLERTGGAQPPDGASGPRVGRPRDAPGHLPTGGLSLGHVGGVEIRIDGSLLIIFALVTVSLGAAVLPGWHPEWTAALTWGVALGAAVLFFASVLAHELSHAFVARVQGLPVRRVTLFLFGGMAHLEEEPRSPRVEFLIAVVGPVVSVAIGVAAWVLGSLLAPASLASAETLEETAAAMAQVGPVATLLLWLGPVNVMLGVFNMVPGFPLDGGRVLRAFLWWTTGDHLKASRWASRSGQAFAWTLMGIGVWSFLAGGVGQGLWLLLIGWFLNSAARSSYERLVVQQALKGVSVRDLMVTRFETVGEDTTGERLVGDYFLASDQRAFPVVGPDGGFLGLVCFDDIRKLPPERRGTASARELMTAAGDLVTLAEDAPAERALDAMARRDVDQIPIVREGQLLGLVRRRDVVKWLALQEPGSVRAGSRAVGV